MGTKETKQNMNWYKTTQQVWGQAGAGILFICPDDQTALLLLRSDAVEDPGQWGVPGGAVGGDQFFNQDEIEDPGFDNEELWDAAIQETLEELGYFPSLYNVYRYVDFSAGNFVYRTFVVQVPLEEKQKMVSQHRLNWESTDAQWHPLQDIANMPKLHRGVTHVIKEMG